MPKVRCYRSSMWKKTLVMLIGLMPYAADAAPLKAERRIVDVAPAVNAMEMPVLAGLLNKAGWTPTPELSGVFQVGRIFKDDGTGHSLMVRDCFDTEAGSDPYTSSEVVSHMKAGVRVGLGLKVKASASMVRKVRFDVPMHHTIERLAMVPTEACAAMLDTATAAEKGTMYAVQEVLTAVISEQRCGQIDGKGRFILAAADAEVSEVCSQESQKPVAVAYRSVPVAELNMPPKKAKVSLMRPSVVPIDGASLADSEGCNLGKIESVYTTLSSITLNGQMMDARGVENQAWIAMELQRCGYPKAAEAFNAWRDSRRTTNIACATIAGCYPFAVGIWSAVKAKEHRLRMERALLSEPGPDAGPE